MAFGLNKIARRLAQTEQEAQRHVDNATRIYEGANPVQRALIDDTSRYIGAVCPRRSGKTFAVTSKALHYAEKNPGSRILIISLTLKSTVENYWSGSPGGLWAQKARYGLDIKFNTTSHTWVHANGSRGLLAGAETKADIEHLRGAAAEADIVVIDECKSFAPAHLQDLIENVVEPGLMTRNGQLVMIGTPGSLPMGPFYQATCELARTDGQHPIPTCVRWQQVQAYVDEARRLPERFYEEHDPTKLCVELESLYSLHSWTIEDNIAVPGQWKRALWLKRNRGWTEDHPSWRREYLGEWVSDAADLVYAYQTVKAAWAADNLKPCVNWIPDYSHGITGLNPAEGPWHLLLGLDLGFVDDSAMVLVAWSETLKELRHVLDFKRPGLDAQAFTEVVLSIIDQYGLPDMIVADFGGSGAKMLLESINQRFGLAIQPAEKRFKNDFIELLNGDFIGGRVKVIAGSELETELSALQWDLSNDAKTTLARTGRLREDPSCANHLCDALLYIWRYAYHFFATAAATGPVAGSPEWQQAQEDEAIERFIQRRKLGTQDPFGLRRLAEREREGALNRENISWQMPRPTQKSNY
jgi:hypothetical protein